MFVSSRASAEPEVMTHKPTALPMDLNSRIRRRLSWKRIGQGFARSPAVRPISGPLGFDFFSDDRGILNTGLPKHLSDCDVINLHWIAGFVDYEAFFSSTPKSTPVVWTLHDMNVFTGGCHYDQNCGGYVKSCGACPQLGSTDEQDLSRQVWTRKRGVFAGRGEKNIQFVANSYWLEAEAKRSSLLSRFPVTTIHYGLDTRTFSPRDRIFSRSVLDLPADAAVVLFVADSVDNKRKGFALLAEALGKLKDRSDLFLLSLGYGNPSLPDTIRHMHLGVVSDDRFLSLIYSAADVFVIPSLQEAFGQTALEAIACGTPVIGFDVGGIPDTVIPRVTGLLVPPGDVDALRSAIVELLEDHAGRKAMSANCRRVAVEKFALDIQARQYVELYESLTRGSAELQITAQTAAECVGQSDSKSLHSYPVL